MAKPMAGTTPVAGRCVYCGADLVLTWVDQTDVDHHVHRLREGPFCANGHPQPQPRPETEEGTDSD